MKTENFNLTLLNQQLTRSTEDLTQSLLKRDELIAKLKSENKGLKQVTETLNEVQEKEVALSQMLAQNDRKLMLIEEASSAAVALVQASSATTTTRTMTTTTTTTSSKKKSDSLFFSETQSESSGSGANSPGASGPITTATSASSLLSSASSSTSSSSSSIFTKDNSSSSTPPPPGGLHHITDEAPMLETGTVKKIISRYSSQAPLNCKSGGFNGFHVPPPSSGSLGLALLKTTNHHHHQVVSDSFKPLPSTKCIYTMIESETKGQSVPFMITIYKSIEKITLADFKDSIKLKNANAYRIYFKTPDPEFKFLKEEISNDNKVLPNFENRIVAWIHES
jgi:hypothetical protein